MWRFNSRQTRARGAKRLPNTRAKHSRWLPATTPTSWPGLRLPSGAYAATTSSINSLTRAGAYNVNGQRSMFNNFLLDGLDNNAYGESNQGFDNQIIAVPPDSVAQFQVVTDNESAEYGRSSGATINVASQSGTNRFHATVYEFIRNTDLNAAGFFKPLTVSNTGATVPFQNPHSTAISSASTSAAPFSKTSSSSFSTTKASARSSSLSACSPCPRRTN